MSNIVEQWYGMVAENKPLTTNSILVTPSQRTPWQQGALQTNMKTVTVKSVDSAGKPFEAKAVTDTTHEATWLATDSNWTTAPDVQRGEIVEILRFADKNQYFWRERGDGVVQRRLETKRMMVSGSATAQSNPSTTTHYMLEVSGHTGAINLSTPMSNGEYTTYLLTLNGKGGMCSISDGLGNEILIDSKNKICRMRNESESTFELNDQDIAISALGDVGLATKESFLVAAKNVNFLIGESFSVQAGKEATIEAPDINLNGRLHFNGPISQESSPTGEFTATMKGPINVEKDVTAGGVSQINHLHDGVQRGDDKSNKPFVA